MKDVYPQNYKTLTKEAEDDSKKWKDTLCSWMQRINIVKTATLPKAIYRLNVIPVGLSVTLFTELQPIILESMWNHDPELPKQS